MINSALNRLHHDAAVTPRHGTRSGFKVARFSALQLRAIVCIRKTFDHSLIRLVAFLPMTQRELSQRDLTKENQYD
jgi:DNA-binding GntR family transcriptional regulator